MKQFRSYFIYYFTLSSDERFLYLYIFTIFPFLFQMNKEAAGQKPFKKAHDCSFLWHLREIKALQHYSVPFCFKYRIILSHKVLQTISD